MSDYYEIKIAENEDYIAELEDQLKGRSFFALYDNLKDCYDCPPDLIGIFSTKDKAKQVIDKYGPECREYFYIDTITVDVEL